MKKKVWTVCLVLALLCSAFPACAQIFPADAYDQGVVYFNQKQYLQAAEMFQAAGNYRDAKKWAYYCEAIDYMINNCSSEEGLNEAYYRFELLQGQEFRDADQWAVYCKARAYENRGNQPKAVELYAGICVYDSMARYLQNKAGSDFLNREDAQAKKSLESQYGSVAGMNCAELYELGTQYYNLAMYSLAADAFQLAGNYEDAKNWHYYCAAISLVTTEKTDSMDLAYVLFEVLEDLQFGNAQDWILYLKGREYEKMGNAPKAIECYKKIFIYDSAERYLKLQKAN